MSQMVYSGINAVKSRMFYTAQKVLSQERRNKIKHWLASRRKEWAKLYVMRYGNYTAKDLVGEIRNRIPGDFDILMVHSAYDRLLPMYSGKYSDIIQELLELCGKDRTLVMPAFVLGGKAGNPAEFYKTHNFDAKRTPSEMGLLTECFRRTAGAKRSMHPTHSISAVGPLAEELTATHHLAPTPSGKGTPFELMAKKRTVIVGLGVEYYRCLTQVHTAEDLAGEEFPVKFQKEYQPVNVVDATGKKFEYTLTIFKSGTTMNFGVVRTLMNPGELQEWQFKGSQLFLTTAESVTSRLLAAAKKGITVYGNKS